MITFPAGTFKGNVVLRGEFIIYGPNDEFAGHFNGNRYGVLRGTDACEGWKLVISRETTDGVPNLEIYMVKPLK